MLSFLLFLVCIPICCTAQSTVLPPSLGCQVDASKSIRCRHAALSNIIHSFRILSGVNDGALLPRTVDIQECQVPHLPYIFYNFNSSLANLRLTKSQLESVYPEAFTALNNVLETLDLSYNKLRSVPYAISSLGALRDLNLAHNQIVAVEPGAIFRRMPHIRKIDLAYNFLGVATQDSKLRQKLGPLHQHTLQLSVNLTIDVFSLEPATDTLVELNLRGNKLAAVPHQVSKRSLPMLEMLDLSDNLISNLPKLRTGLLPKLKELRLGSNRLQKIEHLPNTLKRVNLTDNPLNCECELQWLLDWAQTNTTQFTMPHCRSPPSIAGTLLSHHKNLCSNRNISASNSSSRGQQPQESNRYELLHVNSTDTSVLVSWRVDVASAVNSDWKVLFRRQTDTPYQLTLSPLPHKSYYVRPEDGMITERRGKVVFTNEIHNLQPNTGYVVCIGLIRKRQFMMESKKCQKIKTQMGVTTSTSTTIDTTVEETTATTLPIITTTLPVVTTTPASTTEEAKVVATNSVTSGQIQVTANKFTKILLTAIDPATNSLTVRWKVLPTDRFKRSEDDNNNDDDALVREGFIPPVWRIRVRRFATFTTTELRVMAEGDEMTPSIPVLDEKLYQYTIRNLDSNTGYLVCLTDEKAVLQDPKMKLVPGFVRPQRSGEMTCKEVVTLTQTNIDSIQVAVATTVSSTVTAFVVAVICICCPRTKSCRRQLAKKKIKSNGHVQLHNDRPSLRSSLKSHNSRNGYLEPKKVQLPEPDYPNSTINSKPEILDKIPPPLPVNPPPLTSIKDVKKLTILSNIPTTDEIYVTPERVICSVNKINSIITSNDDYTLIAEHSSADVTLEDSVDDDDTNVSIDSLEAPPEPPPKNLPPPSTSSSTDGSDATSEVTFSSGVSREGYIKPETIQYIGGQKVQVFIKGSKTLPRKIKTPVCLQDDEAAFHPRYSLPNTFRLKGGLTSSQKNHNHKRSFASIPGMWFHTKEKDVKKSPSVRTSERPSSTRSRNSSLRTSSKRSNHGSRPTSIRTSSSSRERSKRSNSCRSEDNEPKNPHYYIEYV